MYMTMDFCIISCHNVLLVPTVNALDAKVANFGLAKRSNVKGAGIKIEREINMH